MVQIIKEWASSCYGLVIQDDKIESQVDRIMTLYGLNKQSYLQALKANHSPVVNATIDAFTVQESYFFRDASLFGFLKKTLLPTIIEEKRKNSDAQLTIWSAGCACGEEIYSIAIYLAQLLPDIKQWDINLLATDINEAALDRGRKGVFTQSSMRATDATIIREYFESHTAPYILKPQIREMVKFEHSNIAEKHKLHLGQRGRSSVKCDVIFCRNVFIYLTQSTIESALNNFYDSLVDEGILFLGPSDLITYYRHNFSVEMVSNIYLLKKSGQKKISHAAIVRTPSPQEIPPTYSQKLQQQTNQLKFIRLSLDNKNYREVLEKIDLYLSTYPETALLNRYKGEALIGLGDAATAIIYLAKSIKLDPLDATSHFLHGVVELDMKNKMAAVDSLQKALYIKNNFPEAAYHLSLLYLQNHQREKGIKLLKQSLIYAKERPQEKPALCTDGTMKQFIQAINASILYYQGQNHE